MYLKNFIGAILIGLIFFANFAETYAAYDLPKIKIEKQKKSSKKISEEKKNVFKSDWKSQKIFEEKIKTFLEAEKNLPASSEERILQDKNLIFVGIYKGHFYFLNRYTIEVKKNSATEKVWTQKIFPVGEKIYSKNLKATDQTFFTDGKNIFNSSKPKNNLADVKDISDKNFLQECFKVGYFYAFGEEFLTD